MSAISVIRILSKANNEEPQETTIIKRCNMSDFENDITDEELDQIIKDMEDTPEDELEFLGDEDIDDEEVDETETEDDGTEEYL